MYIRAVTWLIAVGVLSISLLLFIEEDTFDAPVQVSAVVEVAQESSELIPELPVRLVIPTIGVDAPVQYVGLDPSGTGDMGVPTNLTDVGWYKDSVRPGMLGSAVITGHLNGKGVPEAVFYDLHTLDVGDVVIIIHADHSEEIFYIVNIETYDYDAPTTEVFLSDDGKSRLNLITCGGEWLFEEEVYNKRTVVFTELLTDVE